jgi:hypothetical protein
MEKGQCGNPKRQYKRAPKGTVALIDAAFAEQIDIVENGASRRVSVFEAIFLQLWTKEMSGDKRAIAGIRFPAGWPMRVYHRTRVSGEPLKDEKRKMSDYDVGCRNIRNSKRASAPIRLGAASAATLINKITKGQLPIMQALAKKLSVRIPGPSEKLPSVKSQGSPL